MRARARAKVQQQGCAAAGYHGCCTEGNCKTTSGCYCGVDCYFFRNCCDDITVVGCYREYKLLYQYTKILTCVSVCVCDGNGAGLD